MGQLMSLPNDAEGSNDGTFLTGKITSPFTDLVLQMLDYVGLSNAKTLGEVISQPSLAR